MKSGYILSRVLAFLIITPLFLLACAQKVTPTPSSATPPAIRLSTALPDWEIEWQKLKETARKEGQLIIHGGGVPPLARDGIVKAFKDKFGLEVDFRTGRGAEMSEKLIRERASGIFAADVYVGGGTTPAVNLKPNGILEPLDKVIFLPEVIDEKMWRGSLYNDQAHMIAGGFGSVAPVIFVNSELVKKGDIKSLDNLLDSRYKGNIAINDPTINGVGKSSMQTIYILKGEDYVRKLVQQKPAVIRDQRQQTEWVARGKIPVGIGGEPTIIKEFTQAGAPLVIIVPAEGSFITTGTGTVGMINKTTHPAAARMFINWILTREGQTIWAKAADGVSRRTDVSSEHLDPVRIPQEGIRYIYQNEEFDLASDKYIKQFIEIFQPVM